MKSRLLFTLLTVITLFCSAQEQSNHMNFTFEGSEPFWSLEIKDDSIFGLVNNHEYNGTIEISEKSENGETYGFYNEDINGIINKTWENYCWLAVTDEDSVSYEIFFTIDGKTFKGCGEKNRIGVDSGGFDDDIGNENIMLTDDVEVDSTPPNLSHFIVGCWEITEDNKFAFPNGKLQSIEQWRFRGDEFTMIMLHTSKRGKDESYPLACRIIDDIDGVEYPFLAIRNTEINGFFLVFTIQELTKSKLKLKFDRDKSTGNFTIENDVIEFERIAGPEENME